MSEREKEDETKGMFRLRGKYALPSEGLKHFPPPPPIKGKTNHGVKHSLTFYFDTEEEMEFVRNALRTGKSRVPSGRFLYNLLRYIMEREDIEWLKRKLGE